MEKISIEMTERQRAALDFLMTKVCKGEIVIPVNGSLQEMAHLRELQTCKDAFAAKLARGKKYEFNANSNIVTGTFAEETPEGKLLFKDVAMFGHLRKKLAFGKQEIKYIQEIV